MHLITASPEKKSGRHLKTLSFRIGLKSPVRNLLPSGALAPITVELEPSGGSPLNARSQPGFAPFLE
jgi:hypothetical protein